jgi:Enoyl-CoA hydratase/carnithine racemase
MNNLLMEVENEIAVVTINRPKSLNALNSETLAELDACFLKFLREKISKL